MGYITWQDLIQIASLVFLILSCYINSKKR